MAADYMTNKNEKGHKNLIWETVSLIMKKAAVEFKGGMKKVVDHGSWNETMVIPDPRKEYIQLVEFLSDIVIQEFTEDKEFKAIEKDVATELKSYEGNKIDKDEYILKKLELMRKMLRLIMKNLKDTDYLKGSSYSEGDLDEESN